MKSFDVVGSFASFSSFFRPVALILAIYNENNLIIIKNDRRLKYLPESALVRFIIFEILMFIPRDSLLGLMQLSSKAVDGILRCLGVLTVVLLIVTEFSRLLAAGVGGAVQTFF